VNVRTPTLAVCFKKKRFTEPIWLTDVRPAQRTIVQVRIADRNRGRTAKELRRMGAKPRFVALLYQPQRTHHRGECHQETAGRQRPVPDSFWVKLVGVDSEKLLVIRSKFAPLPDEAVQEILAERGVIADDLHLPPCRVEIVLGLSEPQRLHVVLPTGAELDLPFFVQCTFIQDPPDMPSKTQPHRQPTAGSWSVPANLPDKLCSIGLVTTLSH